VIAPHIGTLNEGSLHAALKEHYARPGDQFEVALDGFVIDIQRADGLIEIQTSSFRAMGRKLDRLLDTHRILLVHPIAVETYLERPGAKARKSPRRRNILDIFDELVSVPTLIDHPNLTLEIALVSVTEVQRTDRRMRRGRGGFRTIDRTLRTVVETRRFDGARDLAALLPAVLPPEFTTGDLAARARISRRLAQRMAFCYRALNVIQPVGRSKAGIRYAPTGAPQAGASMASI
jgi:hypothetical protein